MNKTKKTFMVAVASKLSTHTASSLAAQRYIKLDGVMKLIGCDIVPGLPTLALMKEAATDRIKHTLTITLLLCDVHWTSAQTYRNLQCQFTLTCKEDLFFEPLTQTGSCCLDLEQHVQCAFTPRCHLVLLGFLGGFFGIARTRFYLHICLCRKLNYLPFLGRLFKFGRRVIVTAGMW